MIATRGLGAGYGALPAAGMGVGLRDPNEIGGTDVAFFVVLPSGESIGAIPVVSAGAGVSSSLPLGHSFGSEALVSGGASVVGFIPTGTASGSVAVVSAGADVTPSLPFGPSVGVSGIVSAGASVVASFGESSSLGATPVVSGGASVTADLPGGYSYGPEVAGESYPLPIGYSYGAIAEVGIYFPGRYFRVSSMDGDPSGIVVSVLDRALSVPPPSSGDQIYARGDLAVLSVRAPTNSAGWSIIVA